CNPAGKVRVDRPEEEIAEQQAGESGAVAGHGDEHSPPAGRLHAGRIKREAYSVSYLLLFLFGDFARPGPQPVDHAADEDEQGEQGCDPKLEGESDEASAERRSTED